MFLEPADFNYIIKDDILGRIVSRNDSYILDAAMSAQELMSTYLREKYNVSEIFNKTGTERNPLIKEFMMHLVLHTLHLRLNVAMPAERMQMQETVMLWLEKIAKPTQKGGISIDLPLNLVVEPETRNGFAVISKTKTDFEF